jgi:hypothetical protein
VGVAGYGVYLECVGEYGGRASERPGRARTGGTVDGARAEGGTPRRAWGQLVSPPIKYVPVAHFIHQPILIKGGAAAYYAHVGLEPPILCVFPSHCRLGGPPSLVCLPPLELWTEEGTVYVRPPPTPQKNGPPLGSVGPLWYGPQLGPWPGRWGGTVGGGTL